MALSTQQKAQLKAKLVSKLSENAAANLTWDDLQVGIDTLSDDDKRKILRSLVGGGEDIRAFINTKLQQASNAAVSVEVDAILANDMVPIDLLYRVML